MLISRSNENTSVESNIIIQNEVHLAREYSNENYSQEIKAIELKGKLAGHFVDKHVVAGGGLADVLDKLK